MFDEKKKQQKPIHQNSEDLMQVTSKKRWDLSGTSVAWHHWQEYSQTVHRLLIEWEMPWGTAKAVIINESTIPCTSSTTYLGAWL